MSDDTPASELEKAIDDTAAAVAVQSQTLDELSESADGDDTVGLSGLLDVPVSVTVQIGRTRLPLGDLVRLTPGALIELDRAAYEPADVLVNGRVVARGEIVTIGERYGVRVTSVER